MSTAPTDNSAAAPPAAPAATAVKRAAAEETARPLVKKPNTAANPQQSELQQQIQAQLQAQLQQQLAAAAARGQQANITPEQIQAQAQAMVQCAAQAQAVVAAAKSKGDGLVPMNSAQITALSQIQAQAIVHARKSQGTPQQINTQIQLQAQALVHAHTQAQIAAGIYLGDESAAAPATTAVEPRPSAPAVTSAPSAAAPTADAARPPATASAKASLAMAIEPARVPNPVLLSSGNSISSAMDTTGADGSLVPQAPAPSSSSPQFLAALNGSLNKFWKEQIEAVKQLAEQTEQDFKTHNDLPLARIKRIMKSDEDVRMISAEAPVLFAKACELFILDLSIRSWNYSQLHKRRTLQKEDIREAISKTDVLDFLVDVV